MFYLIVVKIEFNKLIKNFEVNLLWVRVGKYVWFLVVLGLMGWKSEG